MIMRFPHGIIYDMSHSYPLYRAPLHLTPHQVHRHPSTGAYVVTASHTVRRPRAEDREEKEEREEMEAQRDDETIAREAEELRKAETPMDPRFAVPTANSYEILVVNGRDWVVDYRFPFPALEAPMCLAFAPVANPKDRRQILSVLAVGTGSACGENRHSTGRTLIFDLVKKEAEVEAAPQEEEAEIDDDGDDDGDEDDEDVDGGSNNDPSTEQRQKPDVDMASSSSSSSSSSRGNAGDDDDAAAAAEAVAASSSSQPLVTPGKRKRKRKRAAASAGDVVVAPEAPRELFKIVRLYQEDHNSPVTAVAGLDGNLIFAIGPRMMVYAWNKGKLMGMAFVDLDFYIHSIKVIRSILAFHDVFSGVTLMAWRPRLKSFAPLGREPYPPGMSLSCEFSVDHTECAVLSLDDTGNLELLKYLPREPVSKGGRVLIPWGVFNIGTVDGALVRVNASASRAYADWGVVEWLEF
jgi:hypothetical protein